MWKTVISLVLTLIIVPICTYVLDVPLTEAQKGILDILLAVYLVSATLCFVVSTLSKNYSQVDKIWSIIPIVYVWIVAWKTDFEPRVSLMALLVTLWGARLTYNFARRGGYSWKFWEGDEDYRWAELRVKKEFQGPWKWSAFNLFFISFYQMGLILLFTLPILKSTSGSELGLTDFVLACLFLILIAIEAIADQQQWTFQKEKYRQLEEGKVLKTPYDEGFVQNGLWSYVRHPNYAAEQVIWIVFYLFSVSATGIYINWSIAGCLLLLLLFKGSCDFSEGISERKYPSYKNYKNRVGRFLPKLRRQPREKVPV